jgi:uncharacterized alkaline shock family protein YloU
MVDGVLLAATKGMLMEQNELVISGIGISKNVVRAIVTAAAEKVEGVASVGNGVFASSLISVFAPKTSTGMPTVECGGEDGKLHVSVHLSVFYGYPFTKLAADVRQAVNAAVEEQIGVPAESVDVCIDNLVFPKE